MTATNHGRAGVVPMFVRVVAFTRRNALGIVAILIAVSGTAYAAASLPKNSVGTKQLKNGAVTRAKLAGGAVTAAKVKAGSLTGAQIKASTLGLVPKATHATSAANASELQGRTAADFAASTRVLASGWKTLTDCGSGCATNATLLDNGRVSVRADARAQVAGRSCSSTRRQTRMRPRSSRASRACRAPTSTS